MTVAGWVDDVVGFWFDELRPGDWWAGAPPIDERVRRRFGALHATLRADPPAPTALDARGHLAAILVFDQFSRHLHRGRAAAFAADGLALQLALHTIDAGLDSRLPQRERHFVYMPLMHSEDPAMQALSLAKFATLDDPQAMRPARRHAASIERFGRFPDRNAALGRADTEAERTHRDRRPG